MKGFAFFFWLSLAVSAAAVPFSVRAEDRKVIGYIEQVLILPENIRFMAKIDTGARTSSMDVRSFTEFEREGLPWVRFEITNGEGKNITLERQVVRSSKVRRAGAEKETRPVVHLGICLGGKFKNAEVNLNDRHGMSYRLLIGRVYLGERFFVDASAKNLAVPDCPETANK